MPREDGRRRRAHAEANSDALTSSERADVPWAVPRPRPARTRLTGPAPDRTRPTGPRSGADPPPRGPLAPRWRARVSPGCVASVAPGVRLRAARPRPAPVRTDPGLVGRLFGPPDDGPRE